MGKLAKKGKSPIRFLYSRLSLYPINPSSITTSTPKLQTNFKDPIDVIHRHYHSRPVMDQKQVMPHCIYQSQLLFAKVNTFVRHRSAIPPQIGHRGHRGSSNFFLPNLITEQGKTSNHAKPRK